MTGGFFHVGRDHSVVVNGLFHPSFMPIPDKTYRFLMYTRQEDIPRSRFRRDFGEKPKCLLKTAEK